MLRVLDGERLDPPPIWLMRQAGRYLPEYRALREKAGSFLDLVCNPTLASEVTLQPVRRFDLDAAILFSDILVVPWALGRDLRFETGEGPIFDPLDERDALSRLAKIDQAMDRLEPICETVRRSRAALDSDKALIGFCGGPWTVATYLVGGRGGEQARERTRRIAMEEPGFFADLLEILMRASAAFLIRQIEAGADAVQIFESWAMDLPEPWFRRWVILPNALIVADVKRHHPHVPIIGFPRGAGCMLRDYVADTGVDAVSLDTGVPLRPVLRELPPGTPIQGNLDPRIVRLGGEVMESEVERILADTRGAPHVFNLGHGLFPDTPPEHVARLAELVRGDG
ncbi:MAG: uroporphyrinogen decarboxylase [Alphaproteobacteria bacterium]|nr:MAG: uroporphyrinogen decarboxylase [Alphaproteobacteria bacterium]